MRRGPGVLAQTRGTAGEDAAVAYLRGLGCVVEVKRREAEGHGRAVEFVTLAKMRKVVNAARIYAARHGLSESPLRFDVIAIDVIGGNEQLLHHKGAFDAR